MTEEVFDRNSSDLAEQIISAQCSSAQEQRTVLQQLIESINSATQYAPDSCSVTLFGNGFRLNIGAVEAYKLFHKEVGLFLIGEIPAEVHQYGVVIPTDFRSVPKDQSFFLCPIADFRHVASSLRSAHQKYIHAAAHTTRGAPRKTPFSRSHSVGLVSYANRLLVDGSSVPPDSQESDHFFDGAMRRVSSNVYERDRHARDGCIKKHGATCAICNFNFQAVYGDLAAGFIHVHHVTPLSSIRESHQINPAKDLVPLCPNCHCVVHLVNPPYSVAQVKEMLAKIQLENNEGRNTINAGGKFETT